MALPIVTIYLFGFKLPEIPTPLVKVSREYVDQVTHQVIEGKNEFIEQLTHDCYIVQIPRIEGKLHNKLEQLLSFFEQKHFIDDTKMYKDYPYTIDNEDIKMIADELHFAGTDPARRQMLEIEREAYRVIAVNLEDAMEKHRIKMAEISNELEKTNDALDVVNRELDEKKEAIAKKDREIEELRKLLKGDKS